MEGKLGLVGEFPVFFFFYCSVLLLPLFALFLACQETIAVCLYGTLFIKDGSYLKDRFLKLSYYECNRFIDSPMSSTEDTHI